MAVVLWNNKNFLSEYNEEEEKLLLVMEKGDTDFANVIRNRTSLNAINPTLIRFYWQEMLEAVKEIHDKSKFVCNSN